MLVLTNCTFDGHVANVAAHHGGVPRDQAGPRVPVGRGLVRLRALLAVPASAHRPGCRGTPARDAAEPGVPRALREVEGEVRRDRPVRTRGCWTPGCCPTRTRCKLRVYETDLGAQVDVLAAAGFDRRWSATRSCHEVEEAFHEAYFTHTSTSPNLQIIASLDVARRQMELEGYDLVGNAMQLAIQLRREINGHPLISKYFSVRYARRDDPGGVPGVGIPELHRRGHDPGRTSSTRSACDEFFLDPTRVTLLCGRAGYDGAQFQGILTERTRHPGQQDLAQQRAGADQHQQHAQRPRAPDQGARRHLPRASRRGSRRAARAAARSSRRA